MLFTLAEPKRSMAPVPVISSLQEALLHRSIRILLAQLAEVGLPESPSYSKSVARYQQVRLGMA